MMHSAIALLAGEAAMALPTIPAHDKTNKIGVKGCPGTR
jgi:hypothetical protein